MRSPTIHPDNPRPALPAAATPRHVAIILDGNRRWSRSQEVPLAEGYRRGAEKVGDVLGWCEESGVQVATLWALSTSNLNRPHEQIADLLETITVGLQRLAATGRWRIRPIGFLDRLPERLTLALRRIAEQTAGATGMTVNVAIAYDGREEIVSAVRALVADWAAGGASARDLIERGLTAEGISGYLSTGGQPDPDLVIRTSGEQRLSGFLPWQTVQSELYFCDVPWPEFERDHFERALRWYADRERRFGN
jgi:short-chain Z-isoprenyl diphosphate synthase